MTRVPEVVVVFRGTLIRRSFFLLRAMHACMRFGWCVVARVESRCESERSQGIQYRDLVHTVYSDPRRALLSFSASQQVLLYKEIC